jgi:MFS-type transporter involved in bile tolerance (Atg22 family)
MFFIYTGALIGPALFSLVTSISGTVTLAFLLLGLLALLPVPLLLLRDYSAVESSPAAKAVI